MINSFTGDYRFLSNFYVIPPPNGWPGAYGIVYEGIRYPTTEHAYQAAKTLDVDLRQAIANLRSPRKAKEYGQLLPLRPDWSTETRIRLMAEVLKLKFADWGPPIHDCTEEAHALIATYPHELIEGNTWGDTFWGVCNGRGENWLGKLLMQRREELMISYERIIPNHPME